VAHRMNRPIAGYARPIADSGRLGRGHQLAAGGSEDLTRSDAAGRGTPRAARRRPAPSDWLRPGHRSGLTQRGAVP
jgi:hypothetical protein